MGRTEGLKDRFEATECEEPIAARAPDPADCRAEPIYHGQPSAWCLATRNIHCPFSLPFADSYICTHPDRERIVARTSLGRRL